MPTSSSSKKSVRIGSKLTRIAITQELIDRGVRRNSKICVVALAIAEIYPWAKAIQVDGQSIRFSDHRKKHLTGEWQRYWYMTPRAVYQYIVDFDAEKEIKPFTFTLKQPTVYTYSNPKLDEPGATQNNQTQNNQAEIKTKKNPSRNSHTLLRVETKQRRLPPKGNANYRTYGARGLTY